MFCKIAFIKTYSDFLGGKWHIIEIGSICSFPGSAEDVVLLCWILKVFYRSKEKKNQKGQKKIREKK